jgi:WD40 repeat protein
MPFTVYKIESTGNIMVQSGDIPGLGGGTNCFAIPSAEGGFVGTFFITSSVLETGIWDTRRDYGYRISASEDTQVKVYDLDTGDIISTFSVEGGAGVAIQPPPASYASAIAVQSDNPITLSLIDNGSIEQSPPLAAGAGGKYSGYPNGVMFVSIRPNQSTPVYLPIDADVEAYFFANNQTQLTIDGATYTIPAGSSYFYDQPGAHIVQCDNNVILQINFWPSTPSFQGLYYSGAAIPCIETVNVNPNVTLTPIGGFPTMYVIIGAGAAAAVVIVGVLIIRRRKRS